MKMARPTVVLLGLNLALLGGVAYQARLLRARGDKGSLPGPNSSSSDSAGIAALGLREASGGAAASAAVSGSVALAETNRPAFDWRCIESDDYRTFIRNLRAIGCPEQTVRDIVSADVLNAFTARRNEALSNLYSSFKYWDASPSNQIGAGLLQSRRREVDAEMNATLQDLLGQDFLPPDASRAWTQAELSQELSFLPVDAQDKAEGILLQYADTDQAVRTLSDGHVTPGDPAQRQRILDDYDAKRAALANLLTPAQYEQLDMTVSWTADNLRQAMVHFGPTEDEFDIIFRAWRAHDEKLARLYATGQPDPGNQAVFDQIQQALPPDRFQKYRDTWWQ